LRRIIAVVAAGIYPAQATRIVIVVVVIAGIVPATGVALVYSSAVAGIAVVEIVIGIAVQVEITYRLIYHRVRFGAAYNDIGAIWIVVAVPVVITVPVRIE
jgi:hypothetical protein